MQNGILYTIFNGLIYYLRYANLVELFKFVGRKTAKPSNPVRRRVNERFSVDLFIFLKWALIIILLSTNTSNKAATIAVWYLIVTNIYTYFYYHIWSDDAINMSESDSHRVRRRFFNLLFAISFSDYCYSYLVQLPYSREFSNVDTGNCLWFSISNSLAANYEVIKPVSPLGNTIAMTQLILTVIFVTIIVSRSIPQKL